MGADGKPQFACLEKMDRSKVQQIRCNKVGKNKHTLKTHTPQKHESQALLIDTAVLCLCTLDYAKLNHVVTLQCMLEQGISKACVGEGCGEGIGIIVVSLLSVSFVSLAPALCHLGSSAALSLCPPLLHTPPTTTTTLSPPLSL